jgi:hypothetical protein
MQIHSKSFIMLIFYFTLNFIYISDNFITLANQVFFLKMKMIFSKKIPNTKIPKKIFIQAFTITLSAIYQ